MKPGVEKNFEDNQLLFHYSCINCHFVLCFGGDYICTDGQKMKKVECFLHVEKKNSNTMLCTYKIFYELDRVSDVNFS